MLMRRVIPCLDVDAGRVVKGVRFANLRDAGDPAELAARYEAQGADEIVVLDVSATPAGRGHALETVERVRARLSIPLTVGGGVRSIDDAEALLGAGADKVAVNTAAVTRPELLRELADRFGRQCIVLAVDAARPNVDTGGDANASRTRAEVVVRSGRERTGRDVVTWARDGAALGAGEILLTSFDRDGTGHGYDLALIAAVAAAVPVPVVASGGAAHADHLTAALQAGADAVLIASMLHDGVTTVDALKRALGVAGVAVRR